MTVEDSESFPDYTASIVKNLLKKEDITHDYFLDKQPRINNKMRSILVNWMHEVAAEFKLKDQTVHLAVKYVDCYLSRITISKEMLQLIGITALLLASKFVEIQPPPVEEFVWVAAHTYSREQVIQMEHSFLQILQFDLHPPTVFEFLGIFRSILQGDSQFEHFSHYYCDITLQEFKDFHRFKPSVIAAAAVAMAMWRLQWPLDILSALSPYVTDIEAINECCSAIQNLHVKNWSEYEDHAQRRTVNRNQRQNALQVKYATRGGISSMKPSEQGLACGALSFIFKFD